MTRLTVLAATLATISTSTFAGGIDRSGQDISIIFEQGSYAHLSFGAVMPSLSGIAGGVVSSDNMAPRYGQFAGAFKYQMNEKTSLSFIVDQPIGANVKYPLGTGYPLAGTTATIKSTAFTLIGRHQFTERISAHAGLRHQSVTGEVAITGGYSMDVQDTSGFGYLIGAAYEIPDIALRAAITYNSGIDHTMTGTELGGPTSFELRTPQSVNLDLRSGIAADTLLFGSVRWVNWSDFDISPPIYTAGSGSLVYYPKDTVSYTLGVGRKFSDRFSGSIAIGYEDASSGLTGNLGPRDGYLSLQLGGQYTIDRMKISGGIRYVDLGDATARTVGGVFSGNSAIGIGLQLGYSF
ncbi:MAG: hypothetical protein KUG58_09180 [Marinosulfonomonas sp.]|nr:hypothetical protein [Marinosulfonomonas sp.]